MNLDDWKEGVHELLAELPQWREDYPDKSDEVLRAAMILWPYYLAVIDDDSEARRVFDRLAGKHNLEGLILLESEWANEVANQEACIDAVAQGILHDPVLRIEFQVLAELFDVDDGIDRQKRDTLATTQINIRVGESHGQITGMSINGDPAEKQELDIQATYERYINDLHIRCMQLPLSILGLDSTKEHVTLDQVFVPPTSDNTDDRESLLSTVKKDPFVVILGDPGSGKSSFLKYYIAQACRAFHENSGVIPIYMPVRVLNERLRKTDLLLEWTTRKQKLLSIVIDAVLDEYQVAKDGAFRTHFKSRIHEEGCILALDGLDEIQPDLHAEVCDSIRTISNAIQAVKKESWLGKEHAGIGQVLVTCRKKAYQGDVVFKDATEHLLQPFNPIQIEQFASSWYDALEQIGQYTKAQAVNEAEKLKGAILNNEFSEIGKNPMLLTTFAIVQGEVKQVQKHRVQLFNKALDLLITRWEWERGHLELSIENELKELLVDDKRVRSVLQKLAYSAYESSHEVLTVDDHADLHPGKALEVAEQAIGDIRLADKFLSYVNEQVGLLKGVGVETGLKASYSFAHRSFLEYLVGCDLLQLRDIKLAQEVKRMSAMDEQWQTAIQLAGEELYYVQEDVNRLLDIASILCPCQVRTLQDARDTFWAASLASIAKPSEIKANDAVYGGGGKQFIERLRRNLLACLSSALPAKERAACGRLLAQYEDPRLSVITLKDMQFAFIPPGSFLLGDEGVSSEISHGYWMSEFPITVAQFELFIQAKGYENPFYWTQAGWEMKSDAGWEVNALYGEPFELQNHPVVGVSWYEAQAFTKWLDQKMKLEGTLSKAYQVCLPDLLEWEKAARGGEHIPETALKTHRINSIKTADMSLTNNEFPHRLYAWEGGSRDTDNLNYTHTQIGSTSACGCFPLGRSPYGVQELNGQVAEWLRTPVETEQGNVERLWKGGSFDNELHSCRTSFNKPEWPGMRYNFLGFRVVLRPAYPIPDKNGKNT